MGPRGTRRILAWGVALTLLLPVAIAIGAGLGALLGAVGDEAGATVCRRVCLAAGAAWVAAIVVTTAVNGLVALEPVPPRRRGRRRRPRAGLPGIDVHPGGDGERP